MMTKCEELFMISVAHLLQHVYAVIVPVPVSNLLLSLSMWYKDSVVLWESLTLIDLWESRLVRHNNEHKKSVTWQPEASNTNELIRWLKIAPTLCISAQQDAASWIIQLITREHGLRNIVTEYLTSTRNLTVSPNLQGLCEHLMNTTLLFYI